MLIFITLFLTTYTLLEENDCLNRLQERYFKINDSDELLTKYIHSEMGKYSKNLTSGIKFNFGIYFTIGKDREISYLVDLGVAFKKEAKKNTFIQSGLQFETYKSLTSIKFTKKDGKCKGVLSNSDVIYNRIKEEVAVMLNTVGITNHDIEAEQKQFSFVTEMGEFNPEDKLIKTEIISKSNNGGDKPLTQSIKIEELTSEQSEKEINNNFSKVKVVNSSNIVKYTIFSILTVIAIIIGAMIAYSTGTNEKKDVYERTE